MSHNLPAIPPGAKPPAQHGRKTVRHLAQATALVDRIADRLLPYDASEQGSPDQRARPTILVGMLVMFLLFGVIGLWAALVPLATGAVAAGKVVVEANRKEIQHLEGGIVKELLVKEGQSVRAGELLVRLDNTTASARSELLRGQMLAAQASEARLIAERDNAAEIVFPSELMALEQSDAKVHEIIDTQRRLFATRKESVEGQIGVLNQKIAQSGEEIQGLREQVTSANRQIKLLDEEIETVSGLLNAGNATKPRLLALKRQQADLVGQRGQAQAMISRAEQTINEAKISIINQRTEFLNKVVAELKETQGQLSDLVEQSRAATDVARRIDILAPIDGKVTGLAVHTIGGVVKPGETLMSLVPHDDKLIVEARISPLDIDQVREGLEAKVRLTAFKQRFVKPVDGTVVNVSADRFDDQRTGEAYFIARIEIPQRELALQPDMKLSPGMPAETLIVTGKRTMLSYLTSPIRDSFSRAFREQ